MKSLIVVIALFGSLNVMAQTDSAKGGLHNASAVLSFPRGGVSFGIGYEYMAQDSMGYEAHLRMFNRNTEVGKTSDGMMIVGVGAGHHFYKKSWDLAFTPSFNFINITSAATNGKDATVVGPGLSVSLLTQVTTSIAIGIDWSNYWAWFDDVYAGKRIDDLALKARFSF